VKDRRTRLHVDILYSVQLLLFSLASVRAGRAVTRLRKLPAGQEQHPRLLGSVSAPGPTSRVANHEETKAGPPARTACPFDPTCRDQPRLPASSPHQDEVGQVRRGAGRNAGLDRASQVLRLVSSSRASPASPLGLRGTAQRDLPLPRLPLRCRRDGNACTKCLSSWRRRRAGKRGSVLRVIGANQFGRTDQG